MRFPARALLALILPAVLAMACVAEPLPPGPVAGDPADTAAPGTGGDKTDFYGQTPPVQLPAQERGCQGQALLELDGHVLSRRETDGTQRELFRLGAASGVAAEHVVVNQWEVRGRHTALVGFLNAAFGQPIRYEYVVLDTRGTVVFHRVQPEPYNPTVHLGDDGSLAVAGGQGWLGRPDGTVTELGRYQPVMPARADGQLLVADGQPWLEEVPKGWLDLETRQFSPLATPAGPYSAFRAVGGQTVYVAGDERQASVVLATPTSSVALPVPGDATYLGAVADGGADGRFVLLQGSETGALYRLDVQRQQLETVAPWSGSGEGRRGQPALGPDGAVLAMFPQAGGELQLRRTADLGATWETVGASMQQGQQFGGGSHLVALARQQRVLILNFSTGYGDYLNEVQLVSADRAPERVSVGGLYVNGGVHPGAADLSADGTCAATWVQREGTVFDENARFDLVLVDPAAAAADPAAGATRVLATTSKVSILQFAQ